MWNHSSVAHSALNRLLGAWRDEAIALVAGAISLGSAERSSRSLRRSPHKVVPRVQHGVSQPRAHARGMALENAEALVPCGDRSDELALDVWSDDGGCLRSC